MMFVTTRLVGGVYCETEEEEGEEEEEEEEEEIKPDASSSFSRQRSVTLPSSLLSRL